LVIIAPRQHLDEIDLGIGRIEALRAELQRMAGERVHGRACECRIIEVIADHTQCEHETH